MRIPHAASPFAQLGLMLLLTATLAAQQPASQFTPSLLVGERVATGARITPTAAPGSSFESLVPLAAYPDIQANQAVTTATSPDGNTLLILTSGYNYWADASFNTISFDEFLFVYDVSTGRPRRTQVLKVPNSFMGVVWNPRGHEFYVAGGINDNVHVYAQGGSGWAEITPAIPLGHDTGLGIGVAPLAAGLAVNAAGTQLLVANLENDSVSLVDLATRSKVDELDLRPGKNTSARRSVAGGEFPLWVTMKGDDKAYVSSLRDREVVVLRVTGGKVQIAKRVPVSGNPGRMLLDRDQERLFVALDNSDSVAIIDTDWDRVKHTIDVNAPFMASQGKTRFTGSHPNSLALSPDEHTLYVTQGGTNSLAVVPLDAVHERDDADDNDDDDHHKDDKDHRGDGDHDRDGDRRDNRPIGLIPTGWYPNSVSVSADGRYLYVVNAIGTSGPVGRPDGSNHNDYVLQQRAAGFLTLPSPSPRQLAQLTKQTLFNNGALERDGDRHAAATMAFLRQRIKHVIYIVKENRTYDQVLGDLERGNGDPSLTIFPEPISPNHHRLARQFVTLDGFYCSGAVSGDGWVWSTAGRTSDFTEKTIAVNYAGRGVSYDYEGMNRNVNVAQPTLAERRAVNPSVPDDPDLLPGTADVAALDGPGGERGKGYIWDAVRRAGLSVRNYAFYGDWTLNYLPAGQGYPPLLRDPRKDGVRVFFPAATGLRDVSDPYYREYDMDLPDYWRFKEWEFEFDQFAKKGKLPSLSLVELPHDHFGQFGTAIDGVNTPETQMADNDYALGLIVQKVARSPFADSTLIFVVEDDAQDGPDHVDSQRSVAYVVGPYVKQGAVVSNHYSNANMLRTIVDILGVEPMGLQVALAEPMADVFDRRQQHWDYQPIVPEVLRTTELPLPNKTAANSLPLTDMVRRFSAPRHDAGYWAAAMQGQDFSRMDNLDTNRFNRALWEGLKGPEIAYPTMRHGRNMSQNRRQLPGVTDLAANK